MRSNRPVRNLGRLPYADAGVCVLDLTRESCASLVEWRRPARAPGRLHQNRRHPLGGRGPDGRTRRQVEGADMSRTGLGHDPGGRVAGFTLAVAQVVERQEPG